MQLPSRTRTASRRVAATAAAFAALALPASAQAVSPVCTQVNDPFFDATYNIALTTPADFAQFERLSITATPPEGSISGRMELFIDEQLADTDDVLGELEYVFPTVGTYSARWQSLGETLRWAVSCTAPVEPEEEVQDLRDVLAGMGLTKGTATSLDSKLAEVLAYLAAEDTSGACDGLRAFLNYVSAQDAKKLSVAEAEELSNEANAIAAEIGC